MRALVTLAALFSTGWASAYDAAPPMSFAKPTTDGKHVLVMLRPQQGNFQNAIDKKYTRSGLYPADDFANPVWTCDWAAAWSRNVMAANDGVHAMRVPDTDPGLRHWLLNISKPRGTIPAKPADLVSKPALFLYANGKLTKRITLGEVFDCAALTNADCFEGPVIALDQFDDSTGVVFFHIDGERGRHEAVVNFRTGEIAERFDSPRAIGKCGNEGPPDGIFGFGGGSLDGRHQLGVALLAILVAVVTVGAIAAMIVIWRKPDPDAE